MKPFSLYIHIPFCFHKCPYCDFNAYAVSSLPEKEYISALLSEVDYRATLPEWRGRTIQTIYFGGGTPSLFQADSIRKIVSGVCRSFAVDDKVEISLEANPGTLTPESLAGYRDAGVNRLSLGAQSFQRKTLSTLGRMHSPDHIEAAISSARASGITNINIDLMYGVPDQTMEDLEADLYAALSQEPLHLSAYGLTIEKGTPFYLSYRKGSLKLPPEDLLVRMMKHLDDELSSHGFHRYEISNYSVVGREARHNLAYWNGDDYLGVGAGAHSYNAHATTAKPGFGARWSNFALPAKYIEESVARGFAESWREDLGIAEAIFETFFLGLRKIAGIKLQAFEERFGCSVESLYPTLIQVLTEEKLIQIDHGHLALSERGLVLADSVIENFAQPERSLPSNYPLTTPLTETQPQHFTAPIEASLD